MKKILFLSLISILSCSCYVMYQPSNVRHNYGTQTSIVLDKANYRIVRNVEVVINRKSLKKNREFNIYSQLLQNAHLSGSQALINVTIEEHAGTSFGKFVGKMFVAHGTVIEFLQDNGQPIPSVDVQEVKVAISGNNITASSVQTQEQTQEQNQEQEQVDQTNIESSISNQVEANYAYLAWLKKSGNLNEEKVKNSSFDYNKISWYARSYSANDLLKLSKNHDTKLSAYSKY